MDAQRFQLLKEAIEASTRSPIVEDMHDLAMAYENTMVLLTAANKEIERLQEEPSGLYYQLRDEARVLRESLDETRTALTAVTKERDEAKRVLNEWENAIFLNDSLRNRAETAERLWMEERSKCDSKIKEAQESQRQIATAREENEQLTAENAALRAAVAGKTFFHSDEEVNAEIGRLRAKVESYGKALQEIMQDCGDSSCGCCQIDSNIAEAALKEPQ